MADNDFPVPQQGAEQSTALATASGAETESGSTEVAAPAEDTAGSSATAGLDDKPGFFKGFFKDSEMVHRLAILAFLVIFVAAIIFALMSFTSSNKSVETERKLGQYSTEDIGQVLDFLDEANFHYRLTGNNTIVVDATQYNDITEQMLRRGIAMPREKTDDGDKIIMTDTGFGVSQRMENERIKHGREVQLARAIESYPD